MGYPRHRADPQAIPRRSPGSCIDHPVDPPVHAPGIAARKPVNRAQSRLNSVLRRFLRRPCVTHSTMQKIRPERDLERPAAKRTPLSYRQKRAERVKRALARVEIHARDRACT